MFSLGIEALDEIQQQTSAVIRISDADDIVRLTKTIILLINSSMQGEYIFDPAVITFDMIESGIVSTSFYRLDGATKTDSDVITVNLLLGEVCVLESKPQSQAIFAKLGTVTLK